MTARAARPLAPSSILALYLSTLIAVYLVRDPVAAIAAALLLSAVFLISVSMTGATIPRHRWRAPTIFVAWVFIMKVALDVAGGSSINDPVTLLLAGRQAARVAFLVIGALACAAVIPARAVVEELEATRVPRSLRLLVMMLVQYPRVLRDRYDQIVEAQVARGADRPRTIVQRVVHGTRILLPVMQSELNAIGERAGLIHLRGLDVDVAVPDDAVRRTAIDLLALICSAGILLAAIVMRVIAR